MLYCDTFGSSADRFDDLTVFVDQLTHLGVAAQISRTAARAELARSAQYDLARFAATEFDPTRHHLLLLSGHEVSDEKLSSLRRLASNGQVHSTVLGSFPTFQSKIGMKSKLAAVLGESPNLINVANPQFGESILPPVFGVALPTAPKRDDRPVVLLVAPDSDSEDDQSHLLALSQSPDLRLMVLTNGKQKQAFQKRHGTTIPFYNFHEILPSSLASRIQAALIFNPSLMSYRIRTLIANLAVSGRAVADCSPQGDLDAATEGFLRGPPKLAGLYSFLVGTLLPCLNAISKELPKSPLARAVDSGSLLAELPPTMPLRTDASDLAQKACTVFVPTNGVGLGHAQRCSLIAENLETRPVFAAFSSCLPLLQSYGFDAMPLVSRSPLHGREHDNDIVNYLRLSALAKHGGTLVFDGGYVFDSIVRTIEEKRMSAVWVRRGLWQSGQDNSVALDREKVFRRVIIPSEVFDELNQSYSRGAHIDRVGPIVQCVSLQAASRQSLRNDLAKRFGQSFDRLVVTMLGGGVAADRGAQLSAIAGMMAQRQDTLHLIVVWPTAVVPAGLFSWSNTHVVKTHHASVLVAAADLFISAVGYNSFHEAIYNAIPSIFLAQMSAFMDDQTARASAAVSRRLALMVEPTELQTLAARITDVLDAGLGNEIRDRLLQTELPEPGNRRAAQIIEECRV